MMNKQTREQIWAVLSEAYSQVLATLQHHLPGVKMDSGHSHNEAFLFRSYAEYADGERVVVISFNVQADEHKVRIWGDLSTEDGTILVDIMEETHDEKIVEHGTILERTREFASQCQNYASQAERALSGME